MIMGRPMTKLLSWCIFGSLLGAHSLFSQLTLPDIFTDHMVLQRDQPIHLWGTAAPMDTVEVDFSGETKRTVVNRDSTWSVYFTERKADLSPKFIRISNGRDQIELGNVLLGDVWLCIGQSNMEWPMQREMHVKTEKNHADMENLRFYNPTYAGKNVYGRTYGDSIVERLHATKFYQGSWQVSNVNSV